MNKIAIIGEAWGEQEEKERAPFVGYSGYELTRMLNEAGIHRADCHLSNVFNLRPRGNKIEEVCGPRAGALPGYPPLGKAGYVREEFAGEIDRLAAEIVACSPNIIICLGNTPMWAFTGKTAITKMRGTTYISTHCAPGIKVLPTYHPAAILRQWELRPTAILDLKKAARESEWPEIRRMKREIWIEPTLDDIRVFCSTYIYGSGKATVDIETSGRLITCIGFAPTPRISLVIPFVGRTGRAYWPSKELEHEAWSIVKGILEDKVIKKTFQNGLYDIAFLWRSYGIRTFGAEHDTMLLHHALQPEALKGLGFLGSVYCDESNWKQMRERGKTTIKKDD